MLVPKGIKFGVAIAVIFIFMYAILAKPFNKEDRSLSKEKIKRDNYIVCGRILSVEEIETGKSNSKLLVCGYIYNGNIIQSSVPCKIVTKNRFDRGNYNIFIAVLKSDPNINALLEDVEDFKRLDIRPEDTVGVKCNL